MIFVVVIVVLCQDSRQSKYVHNTIINDTRFLFFDKYYHSLPSSVNQMNEFFSIFFFLSSFPSPN